MHFRKRLQKFLKNLRIRLKISGFFLAFGLCGSSSLYGNDPNLPRDIFQNAMFSAAKDQYLAVLQHWFLFQSLQDEAGKQAFQNEFSSLVWAAFGKLDLCPENLSKDQDESAIWSLVLYNSIARHRGNTPARNMGDANLIDSFKRGFGLRTIEADSTLSRQEIESLRPYKDECTPSISLARNLYGGVSYDPALRRRALYSLAQVMDKQLRVGTGRAWIRARLLVLKLAISSESEEALADSLPYLRDMVHAPLEVLKAMDPEMRLYFVQAYAAAAQDPDEERAILLRCLDLGIDLNDAQLIDSSVYLLTHLDPANRRLIWDGERGERLIVAGEAQFFSEGGTMALEKALVLYDARQPIEALRYLARVIRLAPNSRSEGLHDFALRWIKYIILQYRFDEDLITFLHSYLAPATFKGLMNDLVWSSVLMGEPIIVQKENWRTGLNRRLQQDLPRLGWLAQRDIRRFESDLERSLQENPRSTLKFIEEFVAQLRRQALPVMREHLPLLRRIAKRIQEKASQKPMRSAKEQELLQAMDEILLQEQKEHSRQADRQVGEPLLVDLGTLLMPPTRDVPWTFPEPTHLVLDVFREIPFHASPKEVNGSWQVYWNLGEP